MRTAALVTLLAVLGVAASACGSQHGAVGTTTATTSTTVSGGPVPKGFAPVALSAPSATQVWILGTAPCGSGSCTAIVESSDGGDHFAAVGVPPPRAGKLDSIRFVSPQIGYVYGGHAAGRPAPLWVTSDGGAHWGLNAFGDLLAFGTGGGSAYAVTGTCSNGKCDQLELRRANVGSDTWAQGAIDSGPIDPLVAMAVNGSQLWLSVSDTAAAHPKQTLLHSTDGGNSFVSKQSPCVTGLGGTLAASSAAVLWATCPTGMLGSVYRSSDGGATWKALHVGREIANSSQLAPASDTAAVLATGDQGQLLRTTDAGARFTSVQPV